MPRVARRHTGKAKRATSKPTLARARVNQPDVGVTAPVTVLVSVYFCVGARAYARRHVGQVSARARIGDGRARAYVNRSYVTRSVVAPRVSVCEYIPSCL